VSALANGKSVQQGGQKGPLELATAQLLQIWPSSYSPSIIAGMELITVSQAAESLSASTQTIRNWIRSGRLQGVRVGNRFLVPEVEIERMLGDLPAATGEGPWEFDENEPGPALPRAGRDGPGSPERLLGG
jgi:excisionase family DNA binding protein